MKLFQKLICLLKRFGIQANKIELSANDVLNLLSGNEINLGSKQITIKSDNFNVDKDGNMNVLNAILKNITIDGGSIKLNANDFESRIEIVNQNNQRRVLLGSNYLEIQRTTGDSPISIGINTLGQAFLIVEDTSIWKSGITTPNLTQTSLEKIKKNIKKFNKNAIDIIKNSEIYEYNLKTEEDTDKKHIGFVIGNKYKTPNEVISKSGDGIDTYSMTSLLWLALKQETTNKDKRIAELEERLQKLEKEEK